MAAIMPEMKMRPIAETATDLVSSVVIDSFTMDYETRPKDGSTTEEEYRWVARVVLRRQLKDVTQIADPITGTAANAQVSEISGSFKGGTDVTIRLNSAYGGGDGTWNMTSEQLVGIEADGGEFVQHMQQFIAVTAWGDVTWN